MLHLYHTKLTKIVKDIEATTFSSSTVKAERVTGTSFFQGKPFA